MNDQPHVIYVFCRFLRNDQPIGRYRNAGYKTVVFEQAIKRVFVGRIDRLITSEFAGFCRHSQAIDKYLQSVIYVPAVLDYAARVISSQEKNIESACETSGLAYERNKLIAVDSDMISSDPVQPGSSPWLIRGNAGSICTTPGPG